MFAFIIRQLNTTVNRLINIHLTANKLHHYVSWLKSSIISAYSKRTPDSTSTILHNVLAFVKVQSITEHYSLSSGSTINKILSILYLEHAAIAATISSIRSNTNTIPIAKTTGSHNGASTHHHDHVATAVVPVNLRITNTMAIAVNRLEPPDV